MSATSMRLAFAALVICALSGFVLGVQGALPRGGSTAADQGDTVDTSSTGPATNAAPISDASTGAPPEAQSDVEPSDTPSAPVRRAPRPAPSSPGPDSPAAYQVAPEGPVITPVAPTPAREPAPAATPAPSDQDLPPY